MSLNEGTIFGLQLLACVEQSLLPTIEFAYGPRPPQPQDFELWIGDPAEIKAKRVRNHKHDREDARLLLRLMRENNFPKSGYPVQRIGICGNCCGIDIAW